MTTGFLEHLDALTTDLKSQGLYKPERVMRTPQSAHVAVQNQDNLINLCANNYLGLAAHPRVISAAQTALAEWGYGMASVRFICGTQEIHKELERTISSFLGTEETILYPSCFDANGGLFETLMSTEDAVISDELNHASIIDGIRLCKAQRYRYKHNSMEDLEAKLLEAKSARFRMIITDGVFSMDGTIANLSAICDLADKYDALVMFDDCHASGFLGPNGRGTHEYHNVMDRVDIITGTLGKALGGASGGYTSGKKVVVDFLRQRSRPYLFSNTIAPPIVAGALEVFKILRETSSYRDQLWDNTRYFRAAMIDAGFQILPGVHPIVPVMLGDATLASRMSEELLKRGIYVIGFSYPVVPMGKARIRTQLSAAHTRADLEFAVEQFIAVKQELGC
jgi:glycine C-acetyltransferase